MDPVWLESIKAHLPELPRQKKARFVEIFQLTEYTALVLLETPSLTHFFEKTVERGAPPQWVVNWLLGDVLAYLNEKNCGIEDTPLTPSLLAELLDLLEKNKINGTTAKKVLFEVFSSGRRPTQIVEEKGWGQLNDLGMLLTVVLDVLSENPNQVKAFKEGKEKVIGFLIGQVMKKTEGKADPQKVKELLLKEL